MPTPSGYPTLREIKSTRKMRWWYESLVDFILLHPTATHQQIADHFGKSRGAIDVILATDAFKAYARQRREQYTEHHNNAVHSKILGVANKSMELMLESLERKRDTIPLDLLARINEGALKSLGYGAPAPAQTVVNVNPSHQTVVPVAVSIEDLEAARAALRRSQGQLVEHAPQPLPAPTGEEESE
jgi:hypothetical protein